MDWCPDTAGASDGEQREGELGKGYTGGKRIDVTALGANDWFGARHATLAGNRLAVGAINDDGFNNSATDTGAVHLFTFTDNSFGGGRHVGTIGSGYTDTPGTVGVDLAGGVANSDVFGAYVSLAGNRLAAGAPYDDGAGNGTDGAGAVQLFTFADNLFNGGKLAATIGKGYSGGKNFDLASLEIGDNFGTNPSLDGNRLAVGAVLDDGVGNAAPDSGAGYLVSCSDDTFTAPVHQDTIGKDYTGGKISDVTWLAGGTALGVHSYKDLPAATPDELVVGAVPGRLDPADHLWLRSQAGTPQQGRLPLNPGARVGTSSSRRRALLLDARPDLQIEPLRGNVDTRLRKLGEGLYDAIVLAGAGLARLDGVTDGENHRSESIRVERLDPDWFIPAPAQGALALQIRAADTGLAAA